MEDSQKDCKLIFRINEELLTDYKSLCESQGLNMSMRLRKFVEFELLYSQSGVNIIEVLKSKLNS